MTKTARLTFEWKHCVDVTATDGRVIGRTERMQAPGGMIWRTVIDGVAPLTLFYLPEKGDHMVLVPTRKPA